MAAITDVNCMSWLDRWERQREAHIAYRGDRHRAILDFLASSLPESAMVPDLA